MSLVSVAIVSKDNKPLYLKDFRGSRDITESDDFMSVDMFDLAREASNSVSQSAPASSPASDGAGARGSTVPLDAEIGKSCSIDQQFILHSALDRLEQLMEPNGLGAAWRYGRPNQIGHEAMFVGLIGHVDDLRLYAYITTTKIKIIVACEDAFLPGQADQGRAHDVALKNLMIKIHSLYTEYIVNPFTDIHANTIKSSRFNNGLTANVNAFNRNPALTMR